MIQETPWKHSINQLMEYKHFYAIKDNTLFVAVASRGASCDLVPLNRGASAVITYNPYESDEEEVRSRVEEWLNKQTI